MNVLLLVGVAIFFGTMGGKIFQKFKIPQVTGYLVTGLFLGKSVFNIISPELIEVLNPVINFALGIIGFMLGEELKLSLFRNKGRSIYSILFSQGIVTFISVAVLVSIFTGKIYLGILLGAIATATDPASTANVLWENKSRGILTSTLLAIVALDDILALLIYAFAGVFAKALIAHGSLSFEHLWHAFMEIGIGMVVGITGGGILYWLVRFIKDKNRILPFSLGVIILVIGCAVYFKIDLILATILMGITFANIAPSESKIIFEKIKGISEPVYILFFVLVGARLNMSVVFSSGVFLLVVCVFSRAFGKFIGSFLGGIIGNAPKKVTQYIGLSLLPQAGVAIGMAISINHNLSHLGPEYAQVGLTVINITVATTFIFQLIGPPCVCFAIKKADEAGRDVTEEDIMEIYKVSDLVEKNIPIFREDTSLESMVNSIKDSEADHFCVVDKKGNLFGNIAVGDLRSILLEQEMALNSLILTRDVAVPAAWIIEANSPLKDAIAIFHQKGIDFLPVVEDKETKKLVGLIHYRGIMSKIQRELLQRRGSV